MLHTIYLRPNVILYTHQTHLDVANFCQHRNRLVEVHRQLLTQFRESDSTVPTLVFEKINLDAWIRGANDNHKSISDLKKTIFSKTPQEIIGFDTQNYTWITQDNPAIVNSFLHLNTTFTKYDVYSKNCVKLLNNPQDVELINTIKKYKNILNCNEIPFFSNVTHELAQIYEKLDYGTRHQIEIFMNASNLNEQICFLHLETSLFCELSVYTFFSLFFVLHQPGELCNLMYAVNTLIDTSSIKTIPRREFDPLRIRGNISSNSYRSSLLAYKNTIIYSSLLGAGVTSFWYYTKMYTPIKVSESKNLAIIKSLPIFANIFSIEYFEILRENLAYLSNQLGKTLGQTSQNFWGGFLEATFGKEIPKKILDAVLEKKSSDK